MQFEIETQQHAGYTVVSPRGEIDLDTSRPLRESLGEQIVDGNVHVIVDLTQVTFIDSTALGALIGARRRAQSFHGSFAVVCDNRTLLKMFTITGLDQVFTMHTTLDEATAEPPAPDPVED